MISLFWHQIWTAECRPLPKRYGVPWFGYRRFLPLFSLWRQKSTELQHLCAGTCPLPSRLDHALYCGELWAWMSWWWAFKLCELVPLVVMMWYRYLPAAVILTASNVIACLSERSALPSIQLPSGNRLPLVCVLDSWFNYWLSVGCIVCVLVSESFCACKREEAVVSGTFLPHLAKLPGVSLRCSYGDDSVVGTGAL